MVLSFLQGKPHIQAPPSRVTPGVGAAGNGFMALCLGREDEINRHRIDLRALGEQKWIIVNLEACTLVPSPLYQRPSWLSFETPGLTH